VDEKQFAPYSDLKRASPTGCRHSIPISCTPFTDFLPKVEQKSNRLSGLHWSLMCTICYPCATYTLKSQLSSRHQKCLLHYVLKLPWVLFIPVEKLNIGLIRFGINFDYYSACYLMKVVDYDLNIPNQNWSILKHKQTERQLNKDRPTWCHLFYYFTIYFSTCFEC
jgi:hypothetical protein